jgi:hypothetical protein
MSKGQSLAERFWARVVVHKGSCWEWIGATGYKGYGQLYAPRDDSETTVARATHVSWFLRYGKWPKSNLLHSCDNPPCTNPEHLHEGTQKKNAQECIDRGRHNQKSKTHCPQGHPYSEENTRLYSGGPASAAGRKCRLCDSARKRAKYALDKLKKQG